ncbi:MAG: hypothetical protein JKY22_09405 [Flavobacteriaceae bacterium]|nr:hypothetical protein [Flavobacteriaceae bacterium]
MKSTKLLLIFISILTLVSCKKDDGGGEDSFLLSVENLIGSYDHTFFESNKVINGVFQGFPVTVTTTTTADTYDGEITFLEDGTFTTSGAFRKIITMTDGTNTTLTEVIRVLGESGSFTLDANEQTITLSGFDSDNFDNGTYIFIVFNENEIRLMQEYREETGDETTEYSVEIRFRRQ